MCIVIRSENFYLIQVMVHPELDGGEGPTPLLFYFYFLVILLFRLMCSVVEIQALTFLSDPAVGEVDDVQKSGNSKK